VPLRIVSNTADIPAHIVASHDLTRQMWAIEASVAQSGYTGDLTASVGESLTDIVALSEQRVVAGLYARVPQTIMFLLLAGSALSLLMVGYSAGIKGRRSILTASVLILVLGVVTTLVVDLDRPYEGLLTASQQALIDVQQWMGTQSP